MVAIGRVMASPALAQSLTPEQALRTAVSATACPALVPANSGGIVRPQLGGDSSCVAIKQVIEEELHNKDGGSFDVIVGDSASLQTHLGRNVRRPLDVPHDRLKPPCARESYITDATSCGINVAIVVGQLGLMSSKMCEGLVYKASRRGTKFSRASQTLLFLPTPT